jgi:hypothetical protein
MYPNYNGSRPKMQIYHGSADSTLLPNNYNETIKQWAGVFGYDYTKPDSTKANTPQSGYSQSKPPLYCRGHTDFSSYVYMGRSSCWSVCPRSWYVI